jgi:electron transport complex protein RnfD
MLKITSSPHIKEDIDVKKIMWTVSLTLIPAAIGSIYFFGISSLYVILTAVCASVLTEIIIQRLMNRKISIADGSAFLTGLLLAFNLPSDIPLWMVVLGAVFAIGIVKQAFGGLGYNIFNPALGGRVFLFFSYSQAMSSWSNPRGGYLSLYINRNLEAITSATPLEMLSKVKEALVDSQLKPEFIGEIKSSLLPAIKSLSMYKALFLGNIGGCIGETSALLLLLGAFFLLCKRYITWYIPFSYLLGLAGMTWIFGGLGPNVAFFKGDPLFHILAGGAILGAFYMATDMVTSPLTRKGQIIFGLGGGVFAGVLRIWGACPEGVSFSILFMNILVPLINRYTKPKIFGK